MNYIWILIWTLLGVQTTTAQVGDLPDQSKALEIGSDFIPVHDIKLMRGTMKKIDWKRLEQKVVLLDFFDTYCGSCIQAMPKLQQLKDAYPDKFEVITVTWQDKATVDKFFAQNAYLKENKVNLSVIYEDKVLKMRFPHQTVPHAVLLYKGKVRAITSGGFITRESITSLYQNGTIELPLKNDFASYRLPGDTKVDEDSLRLGTIITGYQNGIPFRAFTFEKDSLNGGYKSSLYNSSIYNALLGLAAKASIKKSVYVPRMDRVVWKVKNPGKYYDFEGNPEWDIKYAICYERFDTIHRSDSLQARIIMDDFAGFFNLKVYASVQKAKVLKLEKTEIKPFGAQPNQKALTYRGTAVFAGFTDLSGKFPPIVDNVNSDVSIEIYPYRTLEELNEQLVAYGIKAVYGLEDLEVLVIEELDNE